MSIDLPTLLDNQPLRLHEEDKHMHEGTANTRSTHAQALTLPGFILFKKHVYVC